MGAMNQIRVAMTTATTIVLIIGLLLMIGCADIAQKNTITYTAATLYAEQYLIPEEAFVVDILRTGQNDMYNTLHMYVIFNLHGNVYR